MSKIGLHSSDGNRYPNLALMKLSAWHKSIGDKVEWFMPLNKYDKVYSSKVFTFSPTDPYLVAGSERGGTGYGMTNTLPEHIEHVMPDYSIYSECDYSMGFLTRGCPNKCSWCIVPSKEGNIHANASFEEFYRKDSRDIVFMDNNVLASEHGLREIERLGKTKLRVDFNQGLDARLIDDGIAKLLSELLWLKPVRLACDTKSQMPSIKKAVEMLRKHNTTPKNYFCYVLVKDIDDALERVMFLKDLGVDPFCQPYRDFTANTKPREDQRRFARWVNHKAIFKTVKWEDYNK